MDKKDVDLYLEKIKTAISEEEKLEETQKFYKLISENFAKTRSDRYIITYSNINQELINYCVESGALNVCHEIGFSKILDSTRVIGAVIDMANVSNKDEAKEKVGADIEKFLSADGLLNENSSKEDIDIYDGIATRYFFSCIENNKDIGDLGKKVATTLFDHIPENMSYKDTMLYKLQLLRGSRTRDDIFEITPKDSIEKYEEILFNPKLQSNGKIANFGEYDDLMFEYLSLYGARGVDIDKKEQLFKHMINNSRPGKLNNLKTYSLYFMKSDYDDDQRVTYGFNGTIAKDVLARIHETDGKDTRFTDFEFELFENKYLPRSYTIKKEDSETSDSMANSDLKIELKGYIEEYLEDLFASSSVDGVEIAKYVIRLQNVFRTSDRPKNEKLAKVYDYVKNIDTISALKQNLKPEMLIETDSSDYIDWSKVNLTPENGEQQTEIDWDKINLAPETEEQRTEREHNSGKDSLRRIDYADIALSLMLESDFQKGVNELSKAETFKIFQENGRNIYDSRAIRKLVELYAQNPKLQSNTWLIENMIYKYISTAVSKTDFNLFKEQGVSDLLQLAATKHIPIEMSIKNLVQEGIRKNPSYSMSLEEAEKYVNSFIDTIGKKSIDSSKEVEFDKFLVALTKMRIASPESLLPKNATDFLLEQSFKKDSIINIMDEKYNGVKERTLENLGKLDNKSQNGNKPLSYIYIVRDYIDDDRTLGVHGEKCISIKRENINKLANGNCDVINTIFHENTHMAQALKINSIPQTFKDYMMIKEEIIRMKMPEYYRQNYKLYYKEIDARENAAKKTAEYISKMIPEDSTVDFAENLYNDVIEMICDKFKEKQEKYSLEAQKEGKLYEDGLQKIDSDGEKKKISEIFDRKVSSSEISRNFLKMYPGLELEYKSDGTKRTLSEQLMFANSKKEKINLQMMREIIKDSGIAKSSKDIMPLVAIKKLIIDSKTKDDIEFINGVVSDNMSTVIKNYLIATNEKIKLCQGQLTPDIIGSYIVIRDFVGFANKNPNAPWLEGFKVKNSNEKDLFSTLQSFGNIMRTTKPDIDNIADGYIKARLQEMKKDPASKLSSDATKDNKKTKKPIWKTIFHNSYAQLKEVEADVEGKRIVAEYETNLERKDQTIEEK